MQNANKKLTSRITTGNELSEKMVKQNIQERKISKILWRGFNGICGLCIALCILGTIIPHQQRHRISAPRYFCGASGCENREVELPRAENDGGETFSGSEQRTGSGGSENSDTPGKGNEIGGAESDCDLNRLARAVAIAETGNCTTGIGPSTNNCFGIMTGSGATRQPKVFASPAQSYAEFKYIWKKSYGGSCPNIELAKKWVCGSKAKSCPDAEQWLANVKNNY